MTISESPTPAKAHLHLPGQLHSSVSEQSLSRIKNVPGYTTPVFKGKEEQRAKVQAIVVSKVSILLSVPFFVWLS